MLVLLTALLAKQSASCDPPASATPARGSVGWVSAERIRNTGSRTSATDSAATTINVSTSELRADIKTNKPALREPLSLGDAILSSISSNPEILSLSLSPKRSQTDILTARAALDSNLTLQTSYANDKSPSASSLIGSSLDERDTRFEASISKQLESGTALGLTWTNSRIRNNALFTTLSPQYAAALKLALTQPLLKGFWSGRPGVLIAVREAESQASSIEYQAKLANQVKNVVSAYWAQQLSNEEVAVNIRALALAEELLSEADSSVKLGLQAPIALSDAKSQVAKQREQLISARNRASSAGNELRRITADETLLSGSGVVKLADSPQVTSLELAIDSSMQNAIDNRAELKAQRMRLQATQQFYEYSKNQALPQIDLFGAASVDGLAGRQVNHGDPTTANSALAGDYADALDALESGDYREYEIGLKISHPLENSAATAARRRARIDHTAAQYTLSALERSVTLEVRNAIDGLQSAQERIQAADAALLLAQESNQIGQQRFKNGLSSSREVLERQRDLAAAELADAQAAVDYQIGLAELWRARGELLERYGIELGG